MSRAKLKSGWIESRTGAVSGLSHFLSEKIPVSTGWRNTLGSLVGAFLLLQILTGILLSLYYVPHPEAAQTSLDYVHESMLGGSLVRALHYQGASFIVVALFLHMIRVFLSGAYRAPREMVWLTGLMLAGVVVGLAFTGQLLPFNQMGYWAASVGVEIASSAPVVGPYVRQMMLGGDTVGALTLTRFYTLHVVVLPGLLGLLITIHLYILRKHGPTRMASDTSDDTDTFFPAQFFRDMVVISVGLALLMLTALKFGGPHSPPLNLSDSSYVPRPEWYFNAHFELLRMTPSSLYLAATFVLPTLVGIALVLLPWLDRGTSTRISDRKLVIYPGVLGIVLVIALTLLGVVRNSGHESAPVAVVPTTSEEQDTAGPLIARGKEVFAEEYCSTCHRIEGVGETRGPDLMNVGSRLQEEYLRAWLNDPESFKPETIMPASMAQGEDMDALVAYLMSLK